MRVSSGVIESSFDCGVFQHLLDIVWEVRLQSNYTTNIAVDMSNLMFSSHAITHFFLNLLMYSYETYSLSSLIFMNQFYIVMTGIISSHSGTKIKLGL